MKCERAVDRVWDKLINKMQYTIVHKLAYSFRNCGLEKEEIETELSIIFYEHFYDKYEEDAQFMRFLFIVLKRKLIDIYNKREKIGANLTLEKEKQWHTKHKNKLIKLRDRRKETGVYAEFDSRNDYTVNQDFIIYYKREEQTVDSMIADEIKDRICKRLNAKEQKVFELMVNGYREFEIAKELGISPSVVGNIKRMKIWPHAGEVFELEDNTYERYTTSGRIVCR